VRVDRDRIEPRNDSYRYADLEFSLSRDEVVKLLMTDKLYNSNSLFVRELLQNALDALRYRRAIYGKGVPDWDGGSVVMEHTVNESGYQIVRCTDTGIGMDEEIVRKFLTNVGRSYYRSPEFELQRVAFRRDGVDFDPCAQFGIGFMSCFMFGDQITILTRRDYGPERGYEDPVEVEIHGLGGLLVIRDGPKNQPVGTTVEIVGPRKPAFVDDWTDSVKLCGMVHNHALATEFPIVAKVTIDEIKEEIEIPPTIAARPTFLEQAEVSTIRIIEQDFKEIDSRLSGSVRIAVLVDDHGVPTTANAEAQWLLKEKKAGQGRDIVLATRGQTMEYHAWRESTTCLDGILVCGQPGRGGKEYHLGEMGNHLGLGDPFLVDIRGELKPEITPARTPPDHTFRERDWTWKRIQALLLKAHAKGWEPVMQHVQDGLDLATFWKLTLLHDAPVYEMDGELLWQRLAVPVVSGDGVLSWRKLSEIQPFCPSAEGEKNRREVFLAMPDGARLGFSEELRSWCPPGRSQPDWELRALVMRFARLRIDGGAAVITLRAPESATSPSYDRGLGGRFEHRWVIPFDGEASSLLAAETEMDIVNRSHPVVEFVKSFDHLEYTDLDDFQHFCASAVWVLSERENLKTIVSEKVTKGRQFRRLGILYRALDWNRYDAKFKPPYKVWTAQSGVFEVHHEHLMKWAEVPRE
jgi:hypothetical protein